MPHDETNAVKTAKGLDDCTGTVLGLVLLAIALTVGFILGAWLM